MVSRFFKTTGWNGGIWNKYGLTMIIIMYGLGSHVESHMYKVDVDVLLPRSCTVKESDKFSVHGASLRVVNVTGI